MKLLIINHTFWTSNYLLLGCFETDVLSPVEQAPDVVSDYLGVPPKEDLLQRRIQRA